MDTRTVFKVTIFSMIQYMNHILCFVMRDTQRTFILASTVILKRLLIVKIQVLSYFQQLLLQSTGRCSLKTEFPSLIDCIDY